MSQSSEVCVSCSVAMAREVSYSLRCAERLHFHMALSAWRALERRGERPSASVYVKEVGLELLQEERLERAMEEARGVR